MLTSVLGLTNGYLAVCVLTSAPKGYKVCSLHKTLKYQFVNRLWWLNIVMIPEIWRGLEQNALGNLLVLSLLGGIFAGVILDWLWLIGKGW